MTVQSTGASEPLLLITSHSRPTLAKSNALCGFSQRVEAVREMVHRDGSIDGGGLRPAIKEVVTRITDSLPNRLDSGAAE